MRTVDVAVVGAGPTGLMTAAELRRHGVDVVVLERLRTRTTETKALFVWPRSFELLESLEPAVSLRSQGQFQTDARYYSRGSLIARLRYSDAVRPSVLPQPAIEAFLERHLTSDEDLIQRGVEVVGLEEDSVGVVVSYATANGSRARLRAKYVVGADGASSFVRKSLGVSFVGSTHPLRFLLADVEIDGAFSRDATHYFCSPNGVLVIAPLPAGGFRVFTSAPADTTDSPILQDVQRLVDQRGPGDLRLHSERWVSTFRLHARHATSVRIGRTFLIGDAAHIHSPAGGQGLNTGLADANNLAWKLAFVLAGRSDPSLLDSYEAERVGVAERVVRLAGAQTRLWMLAHPRWILVRDLVLRFASGLRLFNTSYLPIQAGIRHTYESMRRSRPRQLRPIGRLMSARSAIDASTSARGPLRTLLSSLRYSLVVIGAPGPRVAAILTRVSREFGDSIDIVVVNRMTGVVRPFVCATATLNRRVSAQLVRPDGYIAEVFTSVHHTDAIAVIGRHIHPLSRRQQ